MEDKKIILKQPKKINNRPFNFNCKRYINTSYKNNRFNSYDNNNIKNNTLTNTVTDYYYKNPFFYNNNSLNIQLKVLKELKEYNRFSSSTPTTTYQNTNHSSRKTLNNNYIKINSAKKNNNNILLKNKGIQNNLNLPNISIDKNNYKDNNNIKIEINDSDDFNKDEDNIKNKIFNDSIKDMKQNDEYFYKIIFKSKPIFKSDQKLIIDNKFNMIYAENEEQYKKIIEKEYIKLLSKGKKVKSKNNSVSIRLKLKETKNKIKFMKGIMDYSYPGFVLSKIKNMQKKLNEHKKNPNHKYIINGMEKRNKEKEERNNFRKEYLLKSITLYK